MPPGVQRNQSLQIMRVKDLKFRPAVNPLRGNGLYANWRFHKHFILFVRKVSPRRYDAGVFGKGVWLAEWERLSAAELDAKMARFPRIV